MIIFNHCQTIECILFIRIITTRDDDKQSNKFYGFYESF